MLYFLKQENWSVEQINLEVDNSKYRCIFNSHALISQTTLIVVYYQYVIWIAVSTEFY